MPQRTQVIINGVETNVNSNAEGADKCEKEDEEGTAAFAVRPRVYIIVAMPLFASRYWNIFSVENSMFIAAM